MFNRNDIHGSFVDDNEGDKVVLGFNVDDDDQNDDNPVSNTVSAIHKQQLKKNCESFKEYYCRSGGGHSLGIYQISRSKGGFIEANDKIAYE